MTYRLEFLEAALREWKKLDPSIQNQFKKVLGKRLLSPHVPSARLSGPDMQNTYKIKLRNAGYRLVYECTMMWSPLSFSASPNAIKVKPTAWRNYESPNKAIYLMASPSNLHVTHHCLKIGNCCFALAP
jgi:mRNA-degrading endonuclease RelE of RelBE toxin-antitoxin system